MRFIVEYREYEGRYGGGSSSHPLSQEEGFRGKRDPKANLGFEMLDFSNI